MKSKDIIDFARDIKHFRGTNDPFEIAGYYGIHVRCVDSYLNEFTAHTIKSEKYPTIITINNIYDEFSQRVLCAHELGHALLHSSGVNHFAYTRQNIHTNVEYEANLFAIALLGDDTMEDALAAPLETLSGYTLKSILDYNIKKRGCKKTVQI